MEINFLDTLIQIDRNGHLSTTLYKKPTDRNAYLHYRSYHPPKQISKIPYGQFLRCKKICSSNEDAEQSMNEIEAKFHQRGYPSKNTTTQQKTNPGHQQTIPTRGQTQNQPPAHPLHNHLQRLTPPIRNILTKNWHILQTNKDLADTFKETPILAYRRNKKLRDLIGQTHLSRNRKILPRKKPRITGCHACLTSRKNECCRHIISTKTF